MSRLYKLTDVADAFGVSRQTVLRWVDKGIVQALKIDRIYFIAAAELDRITQEGVVDVAKRQTDNNSRRSIS